MKRGVWKIYVRNTDLELGHPGERGLYYTIKNIRKIPKLKSQIKTIIKECKECQCNKHNTIKYGKTNGIIHESEPLKTISSDIVGPYKLLTKNERSTFYCVTFTDICTRFSKVHFIKDITAETICKAFKRTWLQQVNKTPYKIITDQGRQYTSEKFAKLCKEYKIKQTFCTSNNPTANARSERINKQINEILRIHYSKLIPISQLTKMIEKRLNNVYHRTIKFTPFELIYGYNYLSNKRIDKQILLNEANKKSKETSKYDNIRLNNKRKDYEYKIGNMVYLRERKFHKQSPLFSGPYEIMNINEDTATINKKNSLQKVNIKNLKPNINSIKGGECRTPTINTTL